MSFRCFSYTLGLAVGIAFFGQNVFGQIQAMPPINASTQDQAQPPTPRYINDLSTASRNSLVGPSVSAVGVRNSTDSTPRLGMEPDSKPIDRVAELPAGSMLPPGLPPPSETLGVTQAQYIQPPGLEDDLVSFDDAWTWQILPNGVLYQSYLAGQRESRFASEWVSQQEGWFWDIALGGHVGLIRYGGMDPIWGPQGYELDIEGAAFPRLSLISDRDRDLVSTDFRFGIPLTARRGPWEAKFGYYHLSSHLGDEYMVYYDTLDRINYVRDSVVLGVGLYVNPNLRIYSEADWAFNTDGGAKPWAFQFGAEFSPADPTRLSGAPFVAVNGHLRQENDFGGNVCFEAGWQWRGSSGHLTRFGFHYFNGLSEQAQFYNRFEEQVGLGLWYDY